MFLKKTKETGRSMIEMLGVLGVVGLLSTAGIQGYRYLNLHFEISKMEDTIYKGVALINGRQVVSMGALNEFFNKAGMGLNRAFQLSKAECPSPKRGIHCYKLVFPVLNKNIVAHFMNDSGPFTCQSTGASNLTIIFESTKKLAD